MKRVLTIFLLCCLAAGCLLFAGCGSTGGSKPAAGSRSSQPLSDLLARGKQVQGLFYELHLENASVSGGAMDQKVWMQGNKMRIEPSVSGQNSIIIIDGDANVMYTIMPQQKVAIKMALQQDKKPETPMDYSRSINVDGAQIVGFETYEGIKCKVFSHKGATDLQESWKAWISEEYGIPVHMEMTDTYGNKSSVTFKNLKVGPQPADLFQLPADTQIVNS
jgi:outer membrane lipoprotein-sorting protein